LKNVSRAIDPTVPTIGTATFISMPAADDQLRPALPAPFFAPRPITASSQAPQRIGATSCQALLLNVDEKPAASTDERAILAHLSLDTLGTAENERFFELRASYRGRFVPPGRALVMRIGWSGKRWCVAAPFFLCPCRGGSNSIENKEASATAYAGRTI